MKVLGQGHNGIVVADSTDSVKKFYLEELDATEEQTQLTFLGKLQDQGFTIGCTIPRLLEILGKGSWEIADKTYIRCNRMERVPGVCAREAAATFTPKQIETLGRDLGSIAYRLHNAPKAFIEEWAKTNTGEDRLFPHILDYKAAQVRREEADQSVIERVQRACEYLQSSRQSLIPETRLCHLDFTLSNTQVDNNGHVNGLVDWGSFGLAHPSLSLYQLAPRPVWPYVKQQYEHDGGTVREDVVYAAAVVHLAWVPIICNQLGLSIEPDENRDKFEAMYTRFEENAIH